MIRKLVRKGMSSLVMLALLTASVLAGAIPAQAQGGSGTTLAWNWLNPLPQGNSLAGVTYGNSRYVAVGADGTILTSAAGSTWQAVASGTQEALNGITYGGGTFVAVGAAGAVLTSTDGRSWSLVTAPTSADLSAVAYGGGQFMAVGASGTVLVSADGVQWTAETSGTGEDLYAVAYGNGTWVAAGESGENTQSGAYITTLLSSSDNGGTWATSSFNAGGADLYGVAYAAGQFVVVGDSGFGSAATILTSPDGSAWTAQTSGVSGSLDAVGYAPGLAGLLAVGSSGQMLTSADGVTWRTVASGTQQLLAGLACGSTSCVAIGVDGTIVLGSSVQAWTPAAMAAPYSFYPSAVTSGDGLLVAVGQDGNANAAVMTSSDGGASWQAASVPKAAYETALSAVTYADGRFVAVGDNGTVLTSTNGTVWAAASSPVSGVLSASQPDNDLTTVTYGGGQFVAFSMASASGGVTLTSSDGVNWAVDTSGESAAAGNSVYAATYDPQSGTFVATEAGASVLTSPDGTTWSANPLPNGAWALNGITYGNGIFVAAGYVTVFPPGGPLLLQSSNGTAWSQVAPPTGAAGSLNGVAYVPGQGFFTWDGNTIFTSADGATWAALPGLSGSPSIQGAAWNGSGLVAVGNFLPNTGGVAWRYGSTLAFAPVSSTATTADLVAVANGGETTVALGQTTVPLNFCYNNCVVDVPVVTSSGGAWSGQALSLPSPNQTRTVTSLVYGPAGYVGVGNETIITSTGGTDWTVARSVYNLQGVGYGAGEYVSLGVVPDSQPAQWVTLSSPNGSAWQTQSVSTLPPSFQRTAITYGDGMFLAVVGVNTSPPTSEVLSSPDGVTWTQRATLPLDFAYGVTFADGRFLAVGDSGGINAPGVFTSPDGTTWTAVSGLPNTTQAVAYGSGMFVAVGDNGYAAFSTDSSTWTAIPSLTSFNLNSVAYDGSAFVAVGQSGTILGTGQATLAPAISALTPSSGPPGTSLTVAGSGFGTVAGAVYFTPSGGAPVAAAVTSWDDASVGAQVPATLGLGTVSVAVYNETDGLTSSPALFTVTAGPLLASVTPDRGAIGSSVNLAGSGFGTAMGTVVFTEGATTVTQTSVTSWNPTGVVAAVPSGLTPGSVQVAVRSAGGQQSNPLPFTLTGPVLQSLTPTAGAPTSTLTLSGTGFGTVTGAVYFQGSLKTAVQTTVQSWSDSQVVTTVPGVTPGTVAVAVYNPATGLSNSLPFLLGSAKSPITVLKWQPAPIAAPGSLKAGAQATLTVAANDKNGQAIPGAVIYLSFQGATGGGSANADGAALTRSPAPFTADSSGDVVVTYTAPSTLPAAGVDEVIAQNAASAPTATATDSYAFAPVASYTFSPAPVAATGSLAAGSSTTVTLTALDAKGAALAGAPVYLAFLQVNGGGNASVNGSALGAAPMLFSTGADGTLSITYTAPTTLPQGGQDILVAQNAASAPSVSTIDSYTFAPLLPVVTAVSPNYYAAGTPAGPVTITGSGFGGATAVYFGPYLVASFTVVSDKEIIAQPPTCAEENEVGYCLTYNGGPVNVRVQNAAGKSLRTFADLYTFDAAVGTCSFDVPCPIINAITPSEGPMQGGTPFTAAGSNLDPFPGLHVVGSYSMDVGPVSGIGGVTSYSATTLSGSTPAGCGTQYVTAGGLPQPGAAFTYTGEPVVTGISPSTAAPGSLVTITGQNLSPVPGGDITVAFGSQDIGGLNSGGITVVSDTEIRAVVPQATGAVYVRVQSIGTAVGIGGNAEFRCWSQPATAGLFTYASVPVVEAVAPSSGPAAGGTAVTITGRGFAGATRVSFGGTTAASFTVVNDSEITAVAPPGSGSVDVTVTAPGGTSAASPADRFTYAGPVSCTGSGSVSGSGGTVGCGSLASLGVPAGATSGSIEIVLAPSALQQLAAAGNNPADSPAGQQLFQILQQAHEQGEGVVLVINGQQVTVPSSSSSPGDWATFVGQLGAALGLPTAVNDHLSASALALFDIGSGQGTAADLYNLQSSNDWLTSNVYLPPSQVDEQGVLAQLENAERDPWFFGSPYPNAAPGDPWYQVWQNALINAAANGCDAGCQQAVFFGPGIDGSLTSFANTGLCQGVQCYDQAVQDDLQRLWWIENTPSDACLLSGGCGNGDPPPAGDPPQDPPTVAEGLSMLALPLAAAPNLLPPLGTGIQVQLGGGATLAKPATLTLSFDPSQVPPGDTVAAYSFSGGGFTALPTTVAGNQASAPITAAGTYGVLPAPAHAPRVLGVSPASGAAGISVTLTGSGFTGATAVAFGPTAATNFQVVSDGEITATAPPGTDTVAVTVTAPGGSSPQSALSAFTYGSVPSGPALSLTATPQATVTGQSALVQATLTGAASPGGATVQFTTTGGTLSASSAVTGADGVASALLSDGSPETDRVTATASVGGSTLTATVEVPFVTAPAMPTTVTSAVYGDLPSIGAPISLTGSTSGSSVDLTNSVLPGLDVTLDAGSSAVAAAVAGTVSATVYSTTSALQLLAGTPALAVVGTSPSAPTSATFVGPVVQFSLSGTAAQLFGEDSATQDTGALVVTMPYEASAVPAGGTPAVVWLDPSGQWTNAGVVVLGWGGGFVTALLPHLSTYTVVAVQGGVATSESLTASAGSAAVGGSLTLTVTVKDQAGAAMAGVPVSFATALGSVTPTTAVTDGGGQASATLTSAQAGTATVTAAVSGISPPSTVQVGFLAVANSGGGGGAYIPSVPTVTAISPSSGAAAGGTQVTITGTNFEPPATVDFGPNAATGVTVESPTQIAATSPAGSGTVDVTVTTSTGTSATSTADQFTYTAPASQTAPVAPTFSDVPAGFWAYGDIEALAAKGIVSGFPDGTFRPQAPVSRAQFVKMLVLTLRLNPVSGGGTAFGDVAMEAWYAPYVAAAVQANLVQGITASTFGPDQTLTREQMAVLLARALKLTGGTALTFSDAAQIAPWAQAAVQAAVAAGYLNGLPGGTFQPLGAATRAQAAKVLALVLDRGTVAGATSAASGTGTGT